MQNVKNDLRVLVESAMMIALGTVLSLIILYEAPFGGSVTALSMTPVILFSMRRGVKAGLAAGFVFSVIQLLLGLKNIGWIPDLFGKLLCVLLDYILPFTLLGLAGIMRRIRFTKNDKTNLIIAAVTGALAVTLIRFLCHVVSGVVIWHSLDLEWYADDPSHIVNRYSPWIFSIIYSSGYMIPEIITTTLSSASLSPIVCRLK